MVNSNSVEANPMADASRVADRPNSAEIRAEIHADEAQVFRTLSRKRDIAPIAYMPNTLAANLKASGLRRMLTREQGRALETIGHAVDYLNDCYLFEGDDSERINIGGSSTEAIRILGSLRWQILQSAPLREPRTLRLWNALFRRRPRQRTGVAFRRAGDHGS